MKNRLSRSNSGFIGNDNSFKRIADGIVNLNKKNNTIAENYYLSEPIYQRPTEWVQLPSFAGVTQGFAGVFGIYDSDSNFVTLQINTSTGNYIVDWGDGTTGSFSDNAIAYKNYSKSVYAGLTSSVFNDYKTLLIQAYPVSGTILEINLNNAHNQSGFQTQYAYPWLDIQAVGSSCTNFTLANLRLQQVNFIGPNSITSNSSRFGGCRSLKKIINWDTSKSTTFHQMFRNCNSLIECPIIDASSAASGSNNFTYMFENCSSLRYVPLFDTSKATNFENMFTNCYNLATLPEFNTSNVTNFQGAFFGCYSLEEFPYIDLSKTTSVLQFIRVCIKLKKLPKLNYSNVQNFNTAFGNMGNLIEVTDLDTSNATNLNELFGRCVSLKRVDKLDLSKTTTFANAFYECWALENFPSIIRDGNTTCSLNSMAFACQNLKNVPNFNTNRISDWQTAFNGCFSLSSVGFTFNYPSGQTWATSTVFNNTFASCVALKTIGISDVSGISGSTYTNAYSGMFTNCFSLSEVGLSGISENFSIQNCSLGSTALNDLYTRLAVVGASGAGAKTITVSGNWGAASDNPAIAIAKGWSVSG
jgi:hypothetical protein